MTDTLLDKARIPEKAAQILVVGALHLDVIVTAPRFPRTDETVIGHAVDYRLGGKGGNQAVAAARMGCQTAMAGRIGRDRFGSSIRQALGSAGVDHGQVLQADSASGMSVAIVDADGDYGAVIVPGANAEIDPTDIATQDSLGILLLQSEISEPVNQNVMARAPTGCRVILNAAPARPRRPSLASEIPRFAGVDILIVNRTEAAQHCGLLPESHDPAEAAEQLLSEGPKAVIVTLGRSGLLTRTANGDAFELPGRRVRTVSTHGAGDMFAGALAAETCRGTSLRKAADFAQCAAALHVSKTPEERDQLTLETVRSFQNTARTHGESR